MIYTDSVQPDFGLPWPKYEKKDYSGLPPDAVTGDFSVKSEAERLARMDPILYGWTLDGWQEVCANWKEYGTHLVLGGNRSSKSSFGARMVIWLLENIPECRIRCYQVNDDKSIAEQQAYVWEAIPDKYKHMEKKRGQAYSIQYTQQNGFVGSKLILPPKEGYRRGSELIFNNYQQYRNDAQIVEGWWAHFIWCDEEVPQKMFERLLTRLYDARGRMLITFTTIQGWSPLVADILGRVKTIRRRPSTLLHNRPLPVAQESLTRPGTRIYYFWTEDNPFIPYDTIEKMRGRPEAEVLAIAHGIPTRSATTKFPKFKEEVHVIAHERLPWELAEEAGDLQGEITRYHVIDPGGSKPWFMIWAAVDAADRVYIYREWPDAGYGPWGEPSEKAEGMPGPAQKPNGYGIQDYKELILNSEGGEEIFERLIDPRMGVASVHGQEGATNIITEMEDAGFVLHAAPGQKIDHGEGLINDRFSYNDNADIGPTNAPRMYISDRCPNVIEAIKNYTGCSKNEVWKDPIDCMRYLLETGADFVSRADAGDSGRGTFSY